MEEMYVPVVRVKGRTMYYSYYTRLRGHNICTEIQVDA